MINQSLQCYLDDSKKKIDQALAISFQEIKEKSSLYAAISYAVFSGGKRIRPILMLAACEGFGLDTGKILLPACALECIHTYSLIHDDLPCMDNSETRRGKPTVHKIYGEDMALLAGDALLTHAFTILTSEKIQKDFSPQILNSVIHELSYKSGVFGMVEGQAFELMQQRNEISEEILHYIDEHKTAALFSSALSIAAILAEMDKNTIETYNKIGRLFGHAFQIADDIQDNNSDQHQSNYVHLHGMAVSLQKIHEYLDKAKSLLEQQTCQQKRLIELFSLLESQE